MMIAETGTTDTGLDPAAFTATAQRAVAACRGLGMPDQAPLLARDGLLGILAGEDAGGLGLGLAYAAPVVTAAGAGLLAFPLLETMLLARVLDPTLATPLIDGAACATIAWAGSVTGQADAGAVRLDGVVGRAPGIRSCTALLVRIGGGGAALVPLDAPGVRRLDEQGLDPETPDQSVRMDAVRVTPDRLLPAGLWDTLEADALVLRTAAILGAAEACLELAQAHVGPRRQFGRPLVAFQALRHALARQKLGLEGIRGALTRSLDEGNARDLSIRRAAFAAAASHGPAIAEGALQLHGGMGFTWDIPVHLHLRAIRTWAMQGDASAALACIAAALIDEPQHEGTRA